MDEDQRKDRMIRRRSFLKLAGSAAAVTAMSGLSGCGASPEGIGVVEIPLDSVPMGERLRVMWGETPVELYRGSEGVSARSLWCTHTGCEVKWMEDRQMYFCACHEGEFNAQGEVIAGPPPRPLSNIPIRVTDTSIVVGESA